MAEIDKAERGDCRAFKVTKGLDITEDNRKTGSEGKCSRYRHIKTFANMTPRQTLKTNGLVEELHNLIETDSTCFEFGGLEFTSEEIDLFLPPKKKTPEVTL